MNIFLVLRIPHELPVTIHEDVPDRIDYMEYDSFWDDCYSIHSFDNIDEIINYVSSLPTITHRYWEIRKILSMFVKEKTSV